MTIPFSLHHLDRLFKAICKLLSIAKPEIPMSKRVVSSAYKSVFIGSVYRGKSLMNNKNIRGPNIDP